MHILIVKTSALGDVIQAFPVVSYIKRKYPEALIDWVIEKGNKALVLAHPEVDRVIEIDSKVWRKNLLQPCTYREIAAFRRHLRLRHYDVVFDLQGNAKSAFVTSQALSSAKVGFGWKSAPEWPSCLTTSFHFNPPSGRNIREDYLWLVASFFGEAHLVPQELTMTDLAGHAMLLQIEHAEKDKIERLLAHSQGHLSAHSPKVVVCPGSFWPNKQLNCQSLADFMHCLQRFLGCTFLLVWGSPAEHKISIELHQHFPQHSQIVEKLSLPGLQNLMHAADLVLAMDSLPLHLAGTTATPTYSIFGASSSQKYMPQGQQHAAYQGTCPYGRSFEKRCPILRTCPTGACIRSLEAQPLFAHFAQWWEVFRN